MMHNEYCMECRHFIVMNMPECGNLLYQWIPLACFIQDKEYKSNAENACSLTN